MKKIPAWLNAVPAVIAVPVGAALAAVCLVFKPVETIAAPPAGGAPGEVRYVPGTRDRARGAAWVRKRSALLGAEPGLISLNEDELNTWFAASTHTRAARRAGVSASATQLDFRIADGLFQVAAPVAVATPLGARTIIVQLRGVFERAPASPAAAMTGVIMLAPREAYAGSLPLHRIPGATRFLIDTLLDSQTPPAGALDAWRKIERVTISGRELQIAISASAGPE